MYHIIVNPNCGSGHGYQKWMELKRYLDMAKMTYIVHLSKSASDVTRITRRITDKRIYENNAVCNHILLLGGDGTLNHCINGIDDLEHTTVTYLPSGTSNDFSRVLHIPCDPVRAVTALGKKGHVHRIDLGRVYYGTKSRRFSVSSGIGYDATICREVQRSPFKSVFNRMGLGKLIYAAVAIRQFLLLNPCGCDLYLDDEPPVRFDSFLLAAFMNLRCEGGGFPFAPDADFNDGKLDVCLVGNISKWMVPFILPFVFFGKHYGKPGVHHYRASRIRIVTDRPLCAHMDGETVSGQQELIFECGKEKLLYRK